MDLKEHRINNLEDKIAHNIDINDGVVRSAGYNSERKISIITDDMDAAYKIFKTEADNGDILIYPFDSHACCDNCYTIVGEEEMSIDVNTGEQLCDSCLSEF